MFQESVHVFFVDIDPSYEAISVEFETRKMETGNMHMVLALIVIIDTWLPAHCCTSLKLDD